jgi:hypothetical protein
MTISSPARSRESLLSLSGEWTFAATGGELCDAEDGPENAGFARGEKLRARYVSHRVARGVVVYTWARVPGGRFDLFETAGVPQGIRKAPAQ